MKEEKKKCNQEAYYVKTIRCYEKSEEKWKAYGVFL